MVRQLHLLVRLIVVGFLCIILTGCSDAGATIAKRWQSDLEELCTQLESIKDVPTCEKAIPEVEKIVKNIYATSEEYNKLGLSTEAARKLDEDYPNTKSSQRLKEATTKLISMAESNAEIKTQVGRLLVILQKVNTTPEPAKAEPAKPAPVPAATTPEKK